MTDYTECEGCGVPLNRDDLNEEVVPEIAPPDGEVLFFCPSCDGGSLEQGIIRVTLPYALTAGIAR